VKPLEDPLLIDQQFLLAKKWRGRTGGGRAMRPYRRGERAILLIGVHALHPPVREGLPAGDAELGRTIHD
jgi:hypothetical protein